MLQCREGKIPRMGAGITLPMRLPTYKLLPDTPSHAGCLVDPPTSWGRMKLLPCITLAMI